jgi:hypothetical protein
MSNVTSAQLTRLQTVYSQWSQRFLFEANTREARLREMGQRAGRKHPLASASDLNAGEAKLLIDSFQSELGIAETQPPKRLSAREALNAGTSGRHDQANEETTLAGGKDIARIQRELDRLGWDQKRLDAFLASPRGPNARRTVIRTLADANRAYWALKHMKLTHEYDTQRTAS